MEIQGWLRICDIRGIPAHQLSCGQVAPASWMEKFCSLADGKIWMFEPDQLNQFYTEVDSQNGSPEVEMLNGEHSHDARSSPDGNTRNEGGSGNDRLQRDAVPGSSGHNRSYIQKKITPSIRLARGTRMTAGKENVPYVYPPSWVSQGVGGNRPESEIGSNFFTPTIESPDMLDLSRDDEALVRPLHHSILGKEHCFEVITVTGSRCFCCKSAGEREAWIEKLKRTLNPNLDNCRRMEHQLSLWVQEAKGIQIKKKYFCEICLDRQLYARTTSKLKEDGTTFWGEHFEFTSIPEVENITIHLYKDSDKKKKKDKDYVGLINISIKSLLNRQMHEKWYTLSTPSGKNKNNSGELMAIRIKARFQSFCILPMEQYKELGDFITRDYMKLCKALHGTLSVSKKDELSKILVHVMHGTSMSKEFMNELVMNDIAKVEEESLIFRENTLATKAVEHFLRLVGMGYLHEALGDFVSALYESDEDCEVDGSRLPVNAVLEHNQKNLQMCCEIAMHKILGSIKYFPLELREIFSKWRNCCEESDRGRIASRLITASLFLRLICPAILNPYLFGLANELPRPNAARTLTLVAKVIQNLANRSRFGDKEEYMKFMNVFVREQWDQMGTFLNDVADVTKATAANGFEGFIDLGKELAKLHAFLKDILAEMDQNVVNELGGLPEIIATVTKCVDSPPVITMAHSESDIKGLSQDTTAIAGSSLERIVEDSRISTAAENVITQDSNLPPPETLGMVAENLPGLSKTRGPQFQSDNSISTTGSFNNSNNSQRPLLAPLENVMESIDKPGHAPPGNVSARFMTQHSKPPLSFSNPAYQQQSGDLKRGLSSPAVLSSFTVGGDADHSFKGTDNPTTVNSKNRGRPNKSQAPIFFSNPLQALRSQNTSNHNSNILTANGNLPRPSHQNFPPGIIPEKVPAAVESSHRDPDHSSLESSESDHICVHDDTLSSRQSSTTTASSETDPKDPTAVPQNDKVVDKSVNDRKPKSSKPKNRSSNNDSTNDNHQHRKLSATALPVEYSESKVTAVATSTSVPISSARHCVGLQRRQQTSSHTAKQPEINDAHDPSNSRRALIAAAAAPTSSPRGNRSSRPRNGRTATASAVKPIRNRFPDPQSVMTPIDGPAVKEESGHVLAEKTVQPIVSNTASANKVKIARRARPSDTTANTTKPVFPRSTDVVHGSRRVEHIRSGGAKLGQVQANDGGAGLPATPEDPLSPEERTAQWVLNSIAPVPKDPLVQPTSNVPHLGISQSLSSNPANYEELVSCMKRNDALSARLCEVEESNRAFSKREEQLLEQLKERDRREARLLEKYRIVDEKISLQMQEKQEQKKEFSQLVSELEAKHDRDRKELQSVITEKDKIVSKQRTHIANLEESNARLLRTINEMKYSSSSSSPSSGSKEKSPDTIQHQSKTQSWQQSGRYQQDKHHSKQTRGENYQRLSGRLRHREHPGNSELENGLHSTSPTNGEYRVESLSFATSTSSSV